MLLSRSEASRFWDKVDRSNPNGCWPWIGARNAKGYGRFWCFGRQVTASRIAWLIANGTEMPADRLACHTCDNPCCCNPDHIWPGTALDNHRDSLSKGRQKRVGVGPIPMPAHCRKGHELTPDNVISVPRGWRCKTCFRASQTIRNRRNTAKGYHRARRAAAKLAKAQVQA